MRPASAERVIEEDGSLPDDKPHNLLQLIRNPYKPIFESERDQFCFTFFCERTGREFSGYYGSSIWSGAPVQSCIFHPAALHAVIAVGAAHRRMELGIIPEAFEYCAFATESYAKSLRSLNKALTTRDPRSLELATVVPVFLSLFETFQGNAEQARDHMVGWLKILFDRQFRRRVLTTTKCTSVVLTKSNLLNFFARLERQASELLSDFSKIDEDMILSVGDDFPDVPRRFETIEQARDVIFALFRCFVRSLRDCRWDDPIWLKVQQEYGVRLLGWSCVFADSYKGLKVDVS